MEIQSLVPSWLLLTLILALLALILHERVVSRALRAGFLAVLDGSGIRLLRTLVVRAAVLHIEKIIIAKLFIQYFASCAYRIK